MTAERNSVKNTTFFLASILSVLACLAFTIILILNPLVKPVPMPDGIIMPVWRTHLVWQLRWIIYILSLMLPAIAVAVCKFYSSLNDSHARILYSNLVSVIMPLSFLPLVIPCILLRGTLPTSLLSSLIFFFPVLLVSIFVQRIVDYGKHADNDKPSSILHACVYPVFVLIAGASLFTWLGDYFTEIAGPHVGDEAHYYTIARSLKLYHTLDVKQVWIDKLESMGGDPNDHAQIEKLKRNAHLSPMAKDGHWYSAHSVGLPLLLAPFERYDSTWRRHIVLGIISGLGCMGMFMLCSAVGAGTGLSFLFTMLMALSYLWTGYAVRCLPETLGATLAAFAAWSILVQNKKPWLSLIVAAVSCSYLPWVHVRFLPMSLLCFGFYGLQGLFGGARWKSKILRLSVFTIICVTSYIGYEVFQSTMFDSGNSYPISEILMAYPMGAWYSIVDIRGLLYILPIFTWLICAHITGAIRIPKYRYMFIAVLVFFISDLLLSCTNGAWSNGSSLPGKKLVVVLPLFLPGAVIMFKRVSRPAQWLLIFMGLISVGYTLAIVTNLHLLLTAFASGPFALTMLAPNLIHMLNPYVAHNSSQYNHAQVIVSDGWIIMSAILMLVLLNMRSDRTKTAVAIIALMFITAISTHLFVQSDTKNNPLIGSIWREVQLNTYDLEKVYIPSEFAHSSEKLETIMGRDMRIYSVTTKDLGKIGINELISLPNVPVNDWNGRGYRWVTLVIPFKTTKGYKIMRIQGKMTGSAVPIFALRCGEIPIIEQPLSVKDDGTIDEAFSFWCRGGKRDIYVLMRLDGDEGTFSDGSMMWCIGGDKFIHNSGLIPPDIHPQIIDPIIGSQKH